MCAADLAAGLPNSGHNYAMTHSAASLSPAARLSEMFTGMSQVLIDVACYISGWTVDVVRIVTGACRCQRFLRRSYNRG
ncbi:hypothetical protein DPMN_182250 [Dreissena polymorpha]|uniref:Peptidase M16C associated domain-containing protein n=1 Tax=Dreissena polymorpha TaxID=45954 RepID=A0A9D4I566_DREPO|nr:hypothetical protein DPMN_182250 [Dreissena polymorpha]